MKVYKTKSSILVENGDYFAIHEDWDHLINRDDLYDHLDGLIKKIKPVPYRKELIDRELLPPIGTQEVWASGVTYFKSREARMEEAKDSGGGDFYDRVYQAERPELFMKAPHYRTVGSGQNVHIRKDSNWNVPEPELTLVVTSSGKIIGYTAGNDMSSRDIEGLNPLYLPQAKSYDNSTSVGPCIWVTKEPMPPSSMIKLEIIRDKTVFLGEIEISQIKRKFADLVEYLYRETTFPVGCLIMTGTGIVPPNDFTLDHGDEIRITIDHIGTLVNFVA